MNDLEWPSYRGIGAPRYTVEDFAEPDPRTDAFGWGCRVALAVAVLLAVAAAGLGVPLVSLVLLGGASAAVGVSAVVRGGLAWAWLPTARGGAAAVVGGVAILAVAGLAASTVGDAMWQPAAALVSP